MKLYFQSTFTEQTIYTCYGGITEADAISILADLGHTAIISITETTYTSNQSI